MLESVYSKEGKQSPTEVYREAHDAARILLEASFDPYDSREIELYCALEDAARANRRVLDIYEEI